MGLVALDGRWLKINHILCEITGYSTEELLKTNFQNITHPDDLKADLMHVEQLLAGKVKSYQMEKRYFHKNGNIIWILLSVSLIRDKDSKPLYFIAQIQNITLQKEAEAQLKYLAYHDPLTGLANRSHLEYNINQIIANAQRYNKQFAMFILDLDCFKQVNDTLGHDAGDLLLKIVADRLQKCTRPTDITARLGGDEFVAIFTNIANTESVIQIAKKILAVIQKPITINNQELHISTSIGISLYPIDGIDYQTLSKKADQALYHAKKIGKNNYQYYSHQNSEKLSKNGKNLF